MFHLSNTVEVTEEIIFDHINNIKNKYKMSFTGDGIIHLFILHALISNTTSTTKQCRELKMKQLERVVCTKHKGHEISMTYEDSLSMCRWKCLRTPNCGVLEYRLRANKCKLMEECRRVAEIENEYVVLLLDIENTLHLNVLLMPRSSRSSLKQRKNKYLRRY